LLLLINLVQIAILGWVVSQALRAQAERVAPGVSSEARRIRAARRAEIWQKQVRPVAMTMMLLGPGLGLGMSTLVGALGMGALGDAMGTQAGAEVLAQTMARAYREISYAYFLMVGGTFPMLLGPVVVLGARRLDEEGSAARARPWPGGRDLRGVRSAAHFAEPTVAGALLAGPRAPAGRPCPAASRRLAAGTAPPRNHAPGCARAGAARRRPGPRRTVLRRARGSLAAARRLRARDRLARVRARA